jgi:SF-assemblin/beta giardin
VCCMIGNRNLTEEKFQSVVLEELTTLKGQLEMERSERIAEDDEIVQAVNDYTRALQDGLRMVANS